MRPVVVTAILLLVVLMSMSDSAAGDPAEMCKTKYPATPCRKTNLDKGWFQMGDTRCVKAFINSHFGYHDAEMTCRKFPNGHLVSIHDEAELNQVQCAMYRATTEKAHYWIGGYRKEIYKGKMKFAAWVWTDDSTFAYSNWADGQPDFTLSREYCAEMNYLDWGLWSDVNCKEKKLFVCAVKF